MNEPLDDFEILDRLIEAALKQGARAYAHSEAVETALGREPYSMEMQGAAMRWAGALPEGFSTMHEWTTKAHPTGNDAAALFERAKDHAAEWLPHEETGN